MDKAITEGDIITINPQAGSAIVTTTPVPMIVTSGRKLTAEGKAVTVLDDLSNVTIPATYIKGAYVGGTGTITLTTWSEESSKLKKNGKKVLINSSGSKGKYKLTVVTPAIMPGSPPTPDTTISYSGDFTIATVQSSLRGS